MFVKQSLDLPALHCAALRPPQLDDSAREGEDAAAASTTPPLAGVSLDAVLALLEPQGQLVADALRQDLEVGGGRGRGRVCALPPDTRHLKQALPKKTQSRIATFLACMARVGASLQPWTHSLLLPCCHAGRGGVQVAGPAGGVAGGAAGPGRGARAAGAAGAAAGAHGPATPRLRLRSAAGPAR